MIAPPLVSLVIPAYNAAGYIRETLDSVLAQTHRPTAVIVDLRSPLASTMDLVRTLKAMPHLASTPMAVVTGDYYPKPDQVTELTARIKQDQRYRP